jgi:hypothetical protein
MKLSQDTIRILKNFSEINTTILIRRGNTIVTVDASKRILADAKLPESLPNDFAIHDLNSLLTVSSLFENPDFDFKTDKVVIKNNHRSVNYLYADPSVVQDALPLRQKIPTMFKDDSVVQKFTLTEEDLKSLRQAATVMHLPHISFIGDQSGVKVVAQDITNDSLGNFTLQIADKSDKKFHHNLLLDNLRVLPGTYDVSVSPTITHFCNKNADLEYWIVMESV